MDIVATVGETLTEGEINHHGISSIDDIKEVLQGIYDPEIPMNIYDLGLIYNIDLKENGDVLITMTLTTPSCPVAESFPEQVANAVSTLNVGKVDIELVFEPQWTMNKLSDDAKLILNLFDIPKGNNDDYI